MASEGQSQTSRRSFLVWLREPSIDLRLTSGACEALKWVALVCMVVDHVNAVFYARSLVWAGPIGRVAMPVFTVLLGYNLARPGVDWRRMLFRFVAFGALATPFAMALFWETGPTWWPLNVLFTFLVGTVAVLLVQRRHWVSAVSVVAFGGFFVDYFWFGVVLLVAAWWSFADRSRLAIVLFAVAMGGLCYFNGNLYALLALPLIAAFHRSSPPIPRGRWLFWIFYPAHLPSLPNSAPSINHLLQ